MSVTVAESEYTTCTKCKTRMKAYGIVLTWTWINDVGPFCEDCIKRGVTISLPVIFTRDP